MRSAPEPETGDGIESVNTEVRVAEHLGDALDDLEADRALVEAVGPGVVANLVAIKRAEWAGYCESHPDWAAALDQFTDWERDWYLPFH